MNTSPVRVKYFNFLESCIGYRENYRKLMNALFSKEFVYKMEDIDRFRDGIALRYVFADEFGYTNDTIRNELSGACTVLETMVALCHGAEDILYDPESDENKMVKTFDFMLDSLGLADMDDDHFSAEKVDRILNDFLFHKYNEDGRGGLFYIPNEKVKDLSLWYQLNKAIGDGYLS